MADRVRVADDLAALGHPGAPALLDLLLHETEGCWRDPWADAARVLALRAARIVVQADEDADLSGEGPCVRTLWARFAWPRRRSARAVMPEALAWFGVFGGADEMRRLVGSNRNPIPARAPAPR